MQARQTGTTKFLDEDRALACVHCGLCLTACPTYLENGNENDSPRGRIHLMRAVQDGRIALGARVVQHLDRCLGCRACETACPSGVQYGRLIEETRGFIESQHRRSLFQRWLRRVAIERVFPYPNRFRWALLPAKLIRALGARSLLPSRRDMNRTARRLSCRPRSLRSAAASDWRAAA
jgi:glycolate oxidase iron-sulfur subunit